MRLHGARRCRQWLLDALLVPEGRVPHLFPASMPGAWMSDLHGRRGIGAPCGLLQPPQPRKVTPTEQPKGCEAEGMRSRETGRGHVRARREGAPPCRCSDPVVGSRAEGHRPWGAPRWGRGAVRDRTGCSSGCERKEFRCGQKVGPSAHSVLRLLTVLSAAHACSGENSSVDIGSAIGLRRDILIGLGDACAF